MSSAARALTQSRQVRGLLLLVVLVGLVWESSQWILNNDLQGMAMGAMGIGMVFITLLILKDWRSGFICFIVWLLFEDLARKYLGNNMILFFGKDVLAGITFLSLFLAWRKRRAEWFKPPFLVPLGLFFGLAVVQVFNPYSPSILYGLLGLKLYFYYAPLMLVGYAVLRNGADLQQFYVYNLVIGFLIAVLGIIQSIVGLSFLNPGHLAPELEELGNLTRYSPLTGRAVPVPDSVFVSGGRFSAYMILLIVMAMGALAYAYLTRKHRARWAFLAVATGMVAAMQSGSRGCLIYSTVSILLIAIASFWGAPLAKQQRQRLLRASRRVILLTAAGLVIMFALFPDALGARWAFYSETLSPDSPAFELTNRVWSYPIQNLELAFTHEHWLGGQGTGTASLGIQYISQLVGAKFAVSADVESGYGALLVEMGILGPILWMLWTFTYLYYAWKIVRQLRGTIYFPVAFSITWFSFLLLVPFTFGSIGPYQNFILNAYFWILTGVLFRLPHLAQQPQAAPVPATVGRRAVVPVMAAGR